MSNKIDSKELRHLLSGISLLYVEDNVKLRGRATHFFKKFFTEVYQAENGKDGLKLFKKFHPQIVITDIQMPVVNGLEMSKSIREIDKDVKIIITTAYDDKEYLLKTIDIGVTAYLKKPIPLDDVMQTLYTIVKEIQDKKNKNIFNDYLYKIFNNQDNLLLMLQGESVVLVNNYTLSYFGLNNLSEFKNKFKNFGSLLLPHDTFLYEDGNIKYLDELKENLGKSYNVKMLDKEKKLHHFLLKIKPIPDEDNFFILSLTDITQLNLLSLFDKKNFNHKESLKDEKSTLNLLKAAKESQTEINLHNYYKGLPITHNGVVMTVLEDRAVLKTPYLQQKAVELEKKVILTSELFPFDIEFTDIKLIDFQKHIIEIAHPRMIKSTPTKRKYITLGPDSNHTVTLFYNEHKFETEITVLNISVDSVRLSLSFLPAGFKENDMVSIHIMFHEDKKHFIIDTQAKVFKIFEFESSFEIVLILDDEKNVEKSLVDYIAKRQMKLIREFKGLQYEK